MTFYEILGVSRHASQEEIRAAYRELARRHHPDRLDHEDAYRRGIAEENIKAINAAFDTLGNPQKRRQYHLVMWTAHDPARKYNFRDPDAPKPAGSRPRRGENKTRPNPTASLILEIQQLRREKQDLVGRQALKQRRLWISAGATSLLIFIGMSFRAGMAAAPQQAGLVFLFFIGLEIIAMNIIINASGMSAVRGANFSSPIFFAVSVSVGMLILVTTTYLGDLTLAQIPTTYAGIVISAALAVHVFGVSRLAHMQEMLFESEHKAIEDRIQLLEARLGYIRNQPPNEG